ncbi:hypothetical protein VTO42DRAFT_209 [Malbranchea cinnamomea]
MTTDVSDARSLGSWQEAFQHPIPTVRRVEQELRRDIESNKEKLRSLVGVRYRDLLGTAQTIMKMNDQIQQVESNLARVGRHCNPRLMEKKVAHLHELVALGTEKAVGDRILGAQLTLLHNCTSAISKVLRTRSSFVLVAKLLVISRLLRKALIETQNTPPFVNNLSSQLKFLHRILLKRIDKRMASVGSTISDIVESMSAFCLANSSSLEDAVRHFHHIRQEAIKLQLKRENATIDMIVEALSLYLQTLQRTGELLSGRLADALGRLTSQPILGDPVIQGMGELGIDILCEWIPDDIREFTPWIKHNHLTNREAEKIIQQWSRATFSDLCSNAGKVLSGCDDFSELISLRKRLLKAWLPVQYSTRTHSSLEVLQGIRDLVNNQLVSILRAQSEGLEFLGNHISSTLTHWSEMEDQHATQSLWDRDVTSLDFSEGAGTFKEEVVNRMLGKSPNLLQVLEKYQLWMSSVQKRQSMIAELKRDKWEDVAEEDEDEEVEVVNDLLTVDDPALLQEIHESSLVKGFKTLQTSLHRSFVDLNGTNRASQAAFMLRVIREVRRRLPTEYSKDATELFGQGLISNLHGIIATKVISQLRFSDLTRGLRHSHSRCPGRTLWEGDPALPTHSSPMAFNFLRRLTTAMAEQGPDLWTSDAVNELKNRVVKHLVSSIQEALTKVSTPTRENTEIVGCSESENVDDIPSGEEVSPNIAPDAFRDTKIQLLFDLLYLNQFLTIRDCGQLDASEDLGTQIVKLEKELKLSEEKETLKLRVRDYWSRTQLLFGLLG